ncbi:tryptophan synthase subunit alpha [Alteromonas sp. ASW11-130]|uniref:tryptophan synthase subunit alpha n=1 Tax=Alteromonas sp. ASW11-130 TaxID=3015775 RepID=UPI0022423B31|nr:tryptophan synthase subunit alpha [Alteromonas sp. ASW11-130]MCW8091402.1 tryptophan synthase subunit alpha [Alteromonas sp. ASW11-130]
MSRYNSLFCQLRERNQAAFVPFVMIGDPDPNSSFDIICQLIESGADALELGFPYSDPIADGPTIQKAAIRALKAGATPSRCFAVLTKVRSRYPDIPVGLLLYSNLVLAKGMNAFYQQAKDAGVDSILIADVPLREIEPFKQAANKSGIEQILIAPPNASDEALSDVAKASCGYTYVLGRAGVTGAETDADLDAKALLDKLHQANSAPSLLGFGISRPEQVKQAVKAGAAGAISGSATVNIIERNLDDKQQMLMKLDEFIASMKAAANKD